MKQGRINIEASKVHPAGVAAETPRKRRSQQQNTRQEDHGINAKVYTCIQAAIAIAGEDKGHLCYIIPMLLKYNNLPTIEIPSEAAHPRRRPKLRKTTETMPKLPEEEITPEEEIPDEPDLSINLARLEQQDEDDLHRPGNEYLEHPEETPEGNQIEEPPVEAQPQEEQPEDQPEQRAESPHQEEKPPKVQPDEKEMEDEPEDEEAPGEE